MSDDAHQQAYGPTPVRLLAEAAMYFVVISLLFLLLDSVIAALIVGGVLFAALVVLIILDWPKPEKWPFFIRFLVNIYSLAGGIAGFLIVLVTTVVWLNFGLDLKATFPGGPFEAIGGFKRGLVTAAVVTASVTLLGYFLSLAGLRRRGVISGSFVSFIRADLVGFFRSPMIDSIAAALAMAGLFCWFALLPAIEGLVAELFPGKQTDLIDVATLFPVLPIGLLAICVLLAIVRPTVNPNPGLTDEIQSHYRGAVPGERRKPAWPGVVAVIASAVMMVAFVYPIHFGLVATLGVVSGIDPWSSIFGSVDDWITAENERGRGIEQIAADLNRHGFWSADSPGEGLAVLIPGLAEELADASDNRCVAEFAAAPFDPASLHGVDWIPEDWPENGLRYCLRVACPSPVAWDAPPLVIYTSSHPSRNYMWAHRLYLDVFAYGAAPEPGGFCTTDGKLADSFQG